MYKLNDKPLVRSMAELAAIPEGKVLINTINQHSFNVAQTDQLFADALRGGDYLIPDGMSIVKAAKWLKIKTIPTERIAGRDLFRFEMGRLNGMQNAECRMQNTECRIQNAECRIQNAECRIQNDAKAQPNSEFCILHSALSKKVMFMGSSEKVLAMIRERAAVEYPNLEVITYSPPYKETFSDEDNRAMVDAINAANPDLLWIGMTAPKQEKWAFEHWNELNIHCHCGTIGAVFDFFAKPQSDVPVWWQRHGLEWLYRLKSEPRRLFSRYVIGIPKFFWYLLLRTNDK